MTPTPEKVYINSHNGNRVGENYPNTTEYFRKDIYRSLAHSLEIEQDKNATLRKEIEGLKHEVQYYKTLLRTKQDAPHYHDEQTIISKP